MSQVGFEPTISAGERPQTYTLDRAATRTGVISDSSVNIVITLRAGRQGYQRKDWFQTQRVIRILISLKKNPIRSGVPSTGLKRLRREAKHLAFSAKVKNSWRYSTGTFITCLQGGAGLGACGNRNN